MRFQNKIFADRDFLHILKRVLVLFIISRIILTFVGVWTRTNFQTYHQRWQSTQNGFLNIWSIWDSAWYLDIADNGYSTSPHVSKIDRLCCGYSNFGFFPLYPLSINLLTKLTGNSYNTGLIISNFALILASLYLYYLVKDEFNDKIAFYSVNVLFLYPLAFMYSGIFTESSALLFILASVYYSKKSKWLLSGIFGALCALTRVDGILIFPVLVFEYLNQVNFSIRKVKTNISYLFLVPLGTLSFLLYSFFVTKDFLYYFHLKAQYWIVKPSNPFFAIIRMVSTIISTNFDLVATLLLIISLFILLWYVLLKSKISPTLKIYTFIFTLIPAISGDSSLVSFPRHSLLIFPIFIYLATLISKNYVSKILTYTLLIVLQIILMGAWAYGYIM